jgi:outer membrane beta-barrel protein
MHIQHLSRLLSCALLTTCGVAFAQSTPASSPSTQPANEQVIVPQVDRREMKIPKIPSNDYEFGLFVGSYSMESFGSSVVYGARVGYHITEDFFVEGVYGQTKISDEKLQPLLGGGTVLGQGNKLTYYNVSIGYNLFPGEIFFGRNFAKVSAFYVIAGAGTTEVANRDTQTFNIGFGTRVWLKDWAAIQFDVRDHIYKIDLLGTDDLTHNPEITLGATFFF